ncbi:MAG TPA: hypothetical protein VK140_09440 [Ktedonobacteraceae bacterium]|nr:hypothetical protein [Ktedonobacteraceae bacterium]
MTTQVSIYHSFTPCSSSGMGIQVVPANYVTDSTRKQSEGGPPVGVPYGYLCWVTQHENHAAFFASGFGGKYIYVIPDLDLVFVTASTSDRSKLGEDPQELITRFVLPAVTKHER